MLWNGNECGKNQGDENLKTAMPNTDCGRSKTAGEFGVFQQCG
jgi:hypothetical protein